MNRLKGKRALITGATSGIGLETARLFQAEGARVAITGRNAEGLARAQNELGADLVTIEADAADVPQQRSVAQAVAAAFGQLDVLFLNAGIVDFRPLEQWDESGFDHSFATNLKGPFFLVQALLPVFAGPAVIVVNASINAHIGAPNSSVYSATKAGARSLARTLSGELIGRGIRVNAISPGPITTPLYDKLGMQEADRAKMAATLVPAKRFGTPREIAEAALFFASDEAAFMVGSELIIDGGMSTL